MIDCSPARRLEPSLVDELASSSVWCITCSCPPKSPYSFASVLKQCGQLATIFFTRASFSVATFCSAYSWKTYSLPIRRAGSPVHASRGPRIAKSTPAVCRSFAVDSADFFAPLVERGRAADPVQVLRRRVARLRGPSRRAPPPRPPARSAACPTDSPSARCRASSAPPPPGTASRPSRGSAAGRRCGRCARSTPGTPRRTRRRSRNPRSSPPARGCRGSAWPSWAKTASRMPMITSFGFSILPVACAGHASWQRPHSVHEKPSMTSFFVRSKIVATPNRISSSGTSKRSGSSRPARARPRHPHVDRRRRDVEVLRLRQVRAGSRG